MSAFTELLGIYGKRGYEIRTGLNPYHFHGYRDAPFTAILKDGQVLGTGGGISLQEVYFLENLFSVYRPKRLFVIGNAFGWSTVLLGLLNKEAKIVAIDAGVEGSSNDHGTELTNRILREEGLPAKVIVATSPGDVKRVVDAHLGGPVDLAFIDGLHTNEQQELDFDAVRACAAPECLYLFHDVVNFEMRPSFERIVARSGLRGRILMRTPSGMGALAPASLDPKVAACLDAFCETHPPAVADPRDREPMRRLARNSRKLANNVKRLFGLAPAK
jgi:hypothetical protein